MGVFSVTIGTDTDKFFHDSSRGESIRCLMYVTLDGYDFPGSLFMDYPLIVLGWWLDGYTRFATSRSRVINTFMDGPYEYWCEPFGEEATLLTLYTRTLKGRLVQGKPTTVPLEEYRGALYQSAQNLSRVLASLGYSNADVERLRDLIHGMESGDP